MQVQNGTGPGVRRSKRLLLASRTRCNVLCNPPKFGNKVKIGNKVKFGNKFTNWCNVLSIEGVIVYSHVQAVKLYYFYFTFLWKIHIHVYIAERDVTKCFQ